jgi:hypothetical protein
MFRGVIAASSVSTVSGPQHTSWLMIKVNGQGCHGVDWVPRYGGMTTSEDL